MRRSRLVLFTTLAFALACLPVAARTSPLMSANENAAECPDIVATTDDAQATPATKPAAAKRSAVPAAGNKTPPATRGNGTPPVRAPRWHRFLPGMFR